MSPLAQSVEYTYDELGRVVGVYATNGDAAQYVYDGVGNVVEVKRFAATALSLIEFTPNKGKIGITLTIYGTGYSTTATLNIVKFNGVSATVTAATPTKLMVTVPTTATTGKITVGVGANVVTSLDTFEVVAAGGAPVVTAISPLSGAAGTTVTVTGQNFNTTPSRNKVKINGSSAIVTAATATQLTIAVPEDTSSGRVSVDTADGAGSSASDFIIPPAGLMTTDIGGAARAVVDGTDGALSVTGASKTGLILFDAKAGQTLGVAMHTIVHATAGDYINWLSVFDPKNRELNNFANYPQMPMPSGFTLDSPLLTETGTYTIAVRSAQSSATFSAKATVSSDRAGALTINAPATSINIDRKGLNLKYSFVGTVGDLMTAFVAGTTASGVLRVLRPNGVELVSGDFAKPVDTPALPESGTYSVYASPTPADTFSLQLGVTRVKTGAITIDGADTVTSLLQGQNARFDFTGSVGDELSLGLTSFTASPPTNVTVNLLDATNTALVSNSCFLSGGVGAQTCTFLRLASAGTYKLLVTPTSAAAVGLTLTLSRVVNQPLAVNSASVASVPITRKGQAVRLNFLATAGQNIGVGVSDLLLSASSVTDERLILTGPSGAYNSQTSCFVQSDISRSGCQLNLTNAVAGTYSALLTPSYGGTASLKAQANTDLTGTLTFGVSNILSLKSGQNARLSFTGAIGDARAIEFEQLTTVPSGRIINLFVYRPSDTVRSDFGFSNFWRQAQYLDSASPPTLVLPRLPEAGTYTVIVDTSSGESATLQLRYGAVDLAISNVSVGSITKDANGVHTIPVTYTVTNVGSVTAPTTWYDTFYLSANTILDNADTQLASYVTRQISSLAPGASYTINADIRTPAGTTAGAWQLFLKTDGRPNNFGNTNTDNGLLEEPNEANNVTSIAVTLP